MVENIYLYKCDPNKNTTCAKTACHKECFFTVNRNYSLDGVPYFYDEAKDSFVPKEERQNERY